MATLADNIQIIRTAIYGKEMRPAISEALTQSWTAVNAMTAAVEQLNARVDALPDSGGGSGGGGAVPSILYNNEASIAVDGMITEIYSGYATTI